MSLTRARIWSVGQSKHRFFFHFLSHFLSSSHSSSFLNVPGTVTLSLRAINVIADGDSGASRGTGELTLRLIYFDFINTVYELYG